MTDTPSIATSETISLLSRLAAKTVKQDECEVWTGETQRGYGRIKVKGKNRKTHRLTWELHRGPIPEGMGVLHTCDNKPCRRLSHLFLGDAIINNRDRDEKGRGSAGRREGHGHAKVTEGDVKHIRASTAAYAVLAEQYGVSVNTIYKIRAQLIWIDDEDRLSEVRSARQTYNRVARENRRAKAREQMSAGHPSE